MKKVLFGLVLLCGLALISTSCNKDNDNVTPEVETGVMNHLYYNERYQAKIVINLKE